MTTPTPSLSAEHQRALQARGIDWRNLPLAELLDLLQGFLALLRGQSAAQPQAQAAPAGADPQQGLRHEHRLTLHRILAAQSDALGETVDALRDLDQG